MHTSRVYRRMVLGLALLIGTKAWSQGPVALAPGKTLFQLDLSSTPIGEFPTSVKQLSGQMSVVSLGGTLMLKATATSEFLITLPQLLPADFTIEFDIVPKAGGNPQDLSFEGTSRIDQGTGSAHILWHATGELIVVGGGGDGYDSPMPEELKATLPGVLTHVVADFQDNTVRLYTNGRRHYTLNKTFARGRYLRVFLGGQDDATYAVHLAALRISAGSGLGIIAAGAGLPARPPAQAAPPASTTPPTSPPTTPPTSPAPATPTPPGAPGTRPTPTPVAPPPVVTAPPAPKPVDPVTQPAASAPNANRAIDPKLLVGVGMSDITGPISEVVLMGYADGDQKAGGLHTRLYARAYIFANATTNKRVVWVSAELGMMFSSVKQGVLAKLAAKYGSTYTDQNLMLSATHTHSGPGGYSHHTIYNFSIGGFVKENYDAIVDGIAEAISQAHDGLAPGFVSIVSHDLIDSTMVNRSKVAFMLNAEALAVPPASEINPDMTLLKIFTPRRAIGAIAFHAVHNTSMPKTNVLVSSDHKGFAAYLLERANGTVAPFQKYGAFVAAFPNGAEGDMSPNLNVDGVTVFKGPSPDPFESSKIIGTREFNAAFGLLNSTQASDVGSDVDSRHKFMLMPGTPVTSSKFTNGTGLFKTLCTGAYGMSFAAGAEDGRAGSPMSEGMAFGSSIDKAAFDKARDVAVAVMMVLVPPLAAALAPTQQFMDASKDPCQYPKPILLPTGFLHWSPEILPFQILRIGSVAIVGIPGEMTIQAGRRLEAAVRAVLLPLGVQRVLLTGLANEYSGYITTPEEYVSQQYEGASTLFGRLTFDAYQEAFRDLGIAMASGKEAATGPPPGPLGAGQIEWASKVDRDEVPAGQTFGQVLLEPSDVVRGANAQVHMIYRSGNPANDFRRNDTYFRIERDPGSEPWTLVAWDGTPDTRLGWARSTTPNPNIEGLKFACPDPENCPWSTMGVVWSVPQDATPGRYRIRVFGRWKNGSTKELIPYEGTSRTFVIR